MKGDKPKRKPAGRKPAPWLDPLAAQLKQLPPNQSVIVPVPEHYSPDKYDTPFRGYLGRSMKQRGIHITTIYEKDQRAFLVRRGEPKDQRNNEHR